MIATLRQHIKQKRAAIAGDDVGARSYLLGDFHVCMVEAFNTRILADILRDLTARTVLISALYQSTHERLNRATSTSRSPTLWPPAIPNGSRRL